MEKCWECGANLKIIRGEPYHYTESGLDNIYLYGINQYECEGCGSKGVALPQLDALHLLIGKYLVQTEERLTGSEVRFLRKELHLKTKALAKILAVDAATISRWENNKKTISETYDKFLRNVYMCYVSEQKGEVLHKGILELLSHVSESSERKKKKIQFNAADWLFPNPISTFCTA